MVSTSIGAPPSFGSARARRAKGSAIATDDRRMRARFIASGLAQTRDANRRAARARAPTPSGRPRRPPKMRACRSEWARTHGEARSSRPAGPSPTRRGERCARPAKPRHWGRRSALALRRPRRPRAARRVRRVNADLMGSTGLRFDREQRGAVCRRNDRKRGLCVRRIAAPDATLSRIAIATDGESPSPPARLGHPSHRAT